MSTTHTLLTVRGRYSQGLVTLQEVVPFEGARDVLVTFLEDAGEPVPSAARTPQEPAPPVSAPPVSAPPVSAPPVSELSVSAPAGTADDSQSRPVRGQELLLTRRERDVLDLLQSGCTNREIAAELELSSGTIRNYTCSLYDKLKVRNRLEAVTRAAEMGLLG
jgi:DNA-binding CsgD family transcriptional regulator